MTKNINYVSHKKSKVKNNGKPQLPSASSLVEGEIAINYAENVETLSIKNESGTVVTFSSDNYYTEQKLGSGFTGVNSANTVTKVIEENERVIATSLTELQANKFDASGITDYYTKTEVDGMVDEVQIGSTTPSKASVELWVDTNSSPASFEVYTKAETNSLLDTKVDKIDYQNDMTLINSTLQDLAQINIIGGVNVDARGYSESTPTLAVYGGSKQEVVDNVLSHFKLGWFDENGNLIKECAPGRISADKNGNAIAIDGTLKVNNKSCDLLVYTDTYIYRDRLTTTGITVNGSTATTFNVMGLGRAYHAVADIPAKRFEPFAFTPHCAKYASSIGYSYRDGGNVQTSINALTSSINALNKGGGYMGLYYEFYEIWMMAMYLELGTLDFIRDDLFGVGCTNVTPNSTNWYSDSYAGGGGCMYTGNTFGSFWTNTVSSYNFAGMLDPQYMMDGITKAGFANQIGGNKLYTFNGGNVVAVTDTDPSTWENASGMVAGQKYFTVRNVPGCKGLADGVMTGVVNVYVKDTDRIRKYSYPVYRGLALLSGFFTQLEGLYYVVKHTGTTASAAQSQELFYANSWEDVPTATTLYTGANAIVTASTAEGLTGNPALLATYANGGSFPIGTGWMKEVDYNVSLYAKKSIGAAQHTYECGHIWSDGRSYSSAAGTDSNGYLTGNAKSTNASVVGCSASAAYAGRTLGANVSVSYSPSNFAGGFAHPRITV